MKHSKSPERNAVPHREPGRLGRPRDERARDAILSAALSLLREVGYRDATIDAIARRAGVGKHTIYRWWTTRAAVLLESLGDDADRELPLPDTGAVISDVCGLLRRAFERLTMTDMGDVVRSLMAEAQFDPEFAALLRAGFIDRRRAALQQLLTRGVERGELAADTDFELVTDLLYGAMWYRLLNRHGSLDHTFAEALGRFVLSGRKRNR